MSREMTIILGVIAEKRKSSSRWAQDYWIPVGVMLDPTDFKAGDVLLQDDRVTRYYMGHTDLTCYAADTEAYVENFDSGAPALYVVLRQDTDDETPLPWYLHSVTASPHAAQDHEVGAQDIVERIPMPPEIAAVLLGFLDEFHVDVKFRKRRRVDHDPEEQKFGKQPIFLDRKRPGGGDADG